MVEVAGYLLIFVGVGHLLLSTSGTRQLWAMIVAAGWWDAVRLEPRSEAEKDRALGFWATAGSFGVMTIILGALVASLARNDVQVPGWLGFALLGYGLLAASVATRGGFWGFLAPGAILILAAL